MSFDLKTEEEKYRKQKELDKKFLMSAKTIKKEPPDEDGNYYVESENGIRTPYRPKIRLFSWSCFFFPLASYICHRNQLKKRKYHLTGICFLATIFLITLGFNWLGRGAINPVEGDIGMNIVSFVIAFGICAKVKRKALKVVAIICCWIPCNLLLYRLLTLGAGNEVFEIITAIIGTVICGFYGQSYFNEHVNNDCIGSPQTDALWAQREKKAVSIGVIFFLVQCAFYFGVGWGEGQAESGKEIQSYYNESDFESDEYSEKPSLENDVEKNEGKENGKYLIEFGIVCEDAQGVAAPDSLDEVDVVLYLHNQIILKCGANQISQKDTMSYYRLSEFTARFPQVAPSVKKNGALLYTYTTQAQELAYIFSLKLE